MPKKNDTETPEHLRKRAPQLDAKDIAKLSGLLESAIEDERTDVGVPVEVLMHSCALKAKLAKIAEARGE